MLFGDMVERVQYTLGASEIDHNDEREIIKEYINEGVVDIIARTRPYSRVINLTVSRGGRHDMRLRRHRAHGHRAARRRLPRPLLPRGHAVERRLGQLGFAYEEPLLWFSPDRHEADDSGIRRSSARNPMTARQRRPSNPDLRWARRGVPPGDHQLRAVEGGRVRAARAVGGRRALARHVRGPGRGDRRGHRRIKRILAKRVTPQAARGGAT